MEQITFSSADRAANNDSHILESWAKIAGTTWQKSHDGALPMTELDPGHAFLPNTSISRTGVSEAAANNKPESPYPPADSAKPSVGSDEAKVNTG